jgi:ADP-ribose pyrophosphatase YjhB (NUDIX family)
MTCIHKLVADVTVVARGATVLVKYGQLDKYDGQTGWFVPDDFLHRLEHPTDAARRILLEQLGLEAAALRLSHVESFEGDGFWHLVFHFRAEVPATTALALGPNVARGEWFALDDLPPASEVAHEGWGLDTIREVTAQSVPTS